MTIPLENGAAGNEGRRTVIGGQEKRGLTHIFLETELGQIRVAPPNPVYRPSFSRKYRRELQRWNYFKLRIGAILRASCRCAICETAPDVGTDGLACVRTRLRPPIRAARVPTINPCPDSSDSGRPAYDDLPRRYCFVLRPAFPGMIGECVVAVWSKILDKFATRLSVKLPHTPTCCSAPESS